MMNEEILLRLCKKSKLAQLNYSANKAFFFNIAERLFEEAKIKYEIFYNSMNNTDYKKYEKCKKTDKNFNIELPFTGNGLISFSISYSCFKLIFNDLDLTKESNRKKLSKLIFLLIEIKKSIKKNINVPDFRNICKKILSGISFPYSYEFLSIPLYENYEYMYKSFPVNIEMERVSPFLSYSKEPIKNDSWNAVMGDSRDKFFNGYETCLSVYNLMQFCNRLSILEGLKPYYTVCGESDVSKWSDAICNFCDVDAFIDYLSFIDTTLAYNCFSCDKKANGYRIPSFFELREIIKNTNSSFDKNMNFFHIESSENPFIASETFFAYSKSIKDLKDDLCEKNSKKGYCADIFEPQKAFCFVVCPV